MTQPSSESDPGHHSTRVRVMPEVWANRVSEFIRSSGTSEEAATEGRPELIYTRSFLPSEGVNYADFNVRSRHFRCIESFFVETDENDAIRGVVGIDALRTGARVLRVSLIVAHPGEGDPAARLAALLDAVLKEANKYSQADRLRFAYVYDTTAQAPLGVRMSGLFLDPPDALPIREEARIPNDTGQTREAVLLAFDGRSEVAGAAARPSGPG